MNKISIITGAGTGIGRALALELTTNRSKKILGIGRRVQKLRELEIYYPERIKICAADVSTEEGRNKIAEAIPADTTIEFLVHNAAILEPVKPLVEISLDKWRNHMSINVDGPLFLTQSLLKYMDHSRILHISSGAAHHPYMGWGAYCTSKSALHMIYQVLRDELKDKGILVGSIRPGIVDTPMQDNVRQVPEENFPMRSKFIGFKENNQLSDPAIVGQQLAKFLCDTTDAVFSEKELDLRETKF
jgi:benzil reductase ((S)-benzoin forming)